MGLLHKFNPLKTAARNEVCVVARFVGGRRGRRVNNQMWLTRWRECHARSSIHSWQARQVARASARGNESYAYRIRVNI